MKSLSPHNTVNGQHSLHQHEQHTAPSRNFVEIQISETVDLSPEGFTSPQQAVEVLLMSTVSNIVLALKYSTHVLVV